MSDVTVTAHTADGRTVPMAFDPNTDVMVVAIHRQHGVLYAASFNGRNQGHQSPLAECGEDVIAALQNRVGQPA